MDAEAKRQLRDQLWEEQAVLAEEIDAIGSRLAYIDERMPAIAQEIARLTKELEDND